MNIVVGWLLFILCSFARFAVYRIILTVRVCAFAWSGPASAQRNCGVSAFRFYHSIDICAGPCHITHSYSQYSSSIVAIANSRKAAHFFLRMRIECEFFALTIFFLRSFVAYWWIASMSIEWKLAILKRRQFHHRHNVILFDFFLIVLQVLNSWWW